MKHSAAAKILGVGAVEHDKSTEPMRLLQLAREAVPESRFALATSITDLYAERQHKLSDSEEGMIEEILERLVRAFEHDLRRALAVRLARRAKVPRSLILMLADDEIEVAASLLRESLLLEAADLIGVIERRGEGHQLAIAERQVLDESVSDALVGTANVKVIESLLRNPGARLAMRTLEHLVAEARWVERYREPLVLRRELTEELARRLYGLVSSVLRQHILERFDIDPDSVEEDLESILTERLGEVGAAPGSVEPEADEAAPPQLGDHEKISPQLLIRILRKGNLQLFQSLLGELACISKDRLNYVLAQPESRAFAVICRALGFVKPDYAVMLFMIRQLRGTEQHDDPRAIARMIEFYGDLDQDDCFEALRRWRRDPAYQQAIDDFEDFLPSGRPH